MANAPKTAQPRSPQSSSGPILFRFIVAYFCPTILGKILILYYGLNYSYYPGEGYGYGLAASIAFTVFMLGRFVVKYWDSEELN